MAVKRSMDTAAPRRSTSSGLRRGELGYSDADQQISEIAVEDLISNPYQPRVIFDEEKLQELAASIDEHGLLQAIGVAIEDETGNTYIVFGERRLRAVRDILKQKLIKAVHYGTKPARWFARSAYIENLRRDDLKLVERIRGYVTLIQQLEADAEPGTRVTAEMLAKEVGETPQTVGRYLKIARHPDLMRELQEKASRDEEVSLTEYYKRASTLEQARYADTGVAPPKRASKKQAAQNSNADSVVDSSTSTRFDEDSIQPEPHAYGHEAEANEPTLGEKQTHRDTSIDTRSEQRRQQHKTSQPAGAIPFLFGGQRQYITVTEIAELLSALNEGFLSPEAQRIDKSTAPYDAQELLEKWEQLGMTIKGKLAAVLSKM